MCRIKKSNVAFNLYSNDKLIKSFTREKLLRFYISEYKISNYKIKECVLGERVN